MEKANEITASANSGGINIGNITSFCDISTTSGGIRIGNCDLVKNSMIKAKSGGVIIERTNDIYINAKTNSGGMKIGESNRKSEVELKIETSSGSIKANN